mmetsp:Transcript_12326/g.29072  ORF Transcript_12326/g.29072 Transcript_12326/m.29072 type:complete len:165 (+) Transcript_12326:89-583(+)
MAFSKACSFRPSKLGQPQFAPCSTVKHAAASHRRLPRAGLRRPLEQRHARAAQAQPRGAQRGAVMECACHPHQPWLFSAHLLADLRAKLGSFMAIAAMLMPIPDPEVRNWLLCICPRADVDSSGGKPSPPPPPQPPAGLAAAACDAPTAALDHPPPPPPLSPLS